MTENKFNLKNERFIMKFGLPYHIISYEGSGKPIASIFSNITVQYTDFHGIVIPEVATLVQKDIIYTLSERIMYDHYLNENLPFGKLYKDKNDWINAVIDDLVDSSVKDLNLLGPNFSCDEIEELCLAYLKDTKYYIHTDDKNENSLCISIWDESGKRIPVAKIAFDGSVKYLSLDEIEDEFLQKELGDLIFAYLCEITSDDLLLDFEDGWLCDDFDTSSDLVDANIFSNGIERIKAKWVQSVIDDFMIEVISKVYPQYKELEDVPDEILDDYYDNCVSYLFRELMINN